MKLIRHLNYTLKACGISQKSLRRLRDILACWYDVKIVVIAIITGEWTYGYLVIENALGDAFWTGDGFRHDGGGEGGAAATAARALLAIYGIKELQYWETVSLSACNELLRMEEGSGIDNSVLKGNEKLRALFQSIAEQVVHDDDFEMPANEQPQYIRHLVRG